MDRINIGGLKPTRALAEFVATVLGGTDLDPSAFWSGFAKILTDLGPKNHALLAVRDRLQAAIDAWHRNRSGTAFDIGTYKSFLQEIGYIVPEPDIVSVDTDAVDDEIATIAGPQLVVPLSNARYALNAANARWGSLYDALYGTDAIPETSELARGSSYNPRRGAAVVARGKRFLDEAVPLVAGQHDTVSAYTVSDGRLTALLHSGEVVRLRNESQFCGYRGDPAAPEVLLFVNNNLHFEIRIDRNHRVGRDDPAGVADIVLEVRRHHDYGYGRFRSRCRRC